LSNFDVSSYNRQGKAFATANQAAKATTALSTTATGLILYNPWGSGKRLILVDARFVYSTIPAAAGAVMLSMPATVSSAATPLGTAEPIRSASGGAASGHVARAFTIATLPVVNVYIAPITVVEIATQSGSPVPIPEGGFHIIPGTYAHFSHITTVATGIGSYLWVEVPE